MPQADNPLVPDFDVLINGAPMPASAAMYVSAVSVDESVELPSMFALEMSGSDLLDTPVALIDDEDLFAIGNVIEIKLGYVDRLETLLIGELSALEPSFLWNRPPSLTARGYDRRHRLLRGRKTRTFVQQKDSEIAAQIASEAGLSAEADDSGTAHEYVLQADQTDLDFLRERAARIHYEVVVDDKALLFRPVGHAQSDVLTLTPDDDLLEFHPRLSTCGQVSEVAVRGWSPKDKKELSAQARSGDEVSTMGGQKSGPALVNAAFGSAIEQVSLQPIASQAEADQLAKAVFNARALELIGGDGSCWGRTDVRAGTVIKLDGLGRRFSGSYYVTSVLHRYSVQSGYQTRFKVRRNAS